jgi:hypothetical protein
MKKFFQINIRTFLLTKDLSSSKQTAIVSGKDIFCCCEYVICLEILNRIRKTRSISLLNRFNKGDINTQIMW